MTGPPPNDERRRRGVKSSLRDGHQVPICTGSGPTVAVQRPIARLRDGPLRPRPLAGDELRQPQNCSRRDAVAVGRFEAADRPPSRHVGGLEELVRDGVELPCCAGSDHDTVRSARVLIQNLAGESERDVDGDRGVVDEDDRSAWRGIHALERVTDAPHQPPEEGHCQREEKREECLRSPTVLWLPERPTGRGWRPGRVRHPAWRRRPSGWRRWPARRRHPRVTRPLAPPHGRSLSRLPSPHCTNTGGRGGTRTPDICLVRAAL